MTHMAAVPRAVNVNRLPGGGGEAEGSASFGESYDVIR